MKLRFHISLIIFCLSYLSNWPVLAQWSTSKFALDRSSIAATSIGDKAFFAGGAATSSTFGNIYATDLVEIYNATTNQWTAANLSERRYGMVAVSMGNLAFFAGGADLASRYTRVDIYNATTNQWTIANLSQARLGIGAASAGNKVLFAGGSTYSDGCGCNYDYNVVDIYNVSTNQWSVTQLPNLSGYMLAVTVGNKLFFTKQRSGNGAIDIYDVITNQWTTANIPQGQSATAAVSVNNKILFVVGGVFSKQIAIYDVTTGQWTTATLSQEREAISTLTVGNKVFFAGGNTPPSYAYSKVVDIYDATTNQWSVTEFPQLFGSPSAASAANKAVFAGNGTTNVDIYNTDAALPVNFISFTGLWTPTIGAQLSWQTAQEINNDHFEIQRSADAKSFESIDRVAGKGTTDTRTEYSYIDADMPDSINYYRLKQIDLDGSYHFSNIIAISRQENTQPASLWVWPTPVTVSLHLQLSGGKTIREMGVFNVQGRRLSSQSGPQSTTDVSVLPTGIYVLDVLTTDGQRLQSRFVKQ